MRLTSCFEATKDFCSWYFLYYFNDLLYSWSFDFFLLGKRSSNPENIDWAPSVFNHARAARKAKLVMKDQSRKIYEKLCDKRDKSMKKIINRGTKYSRYK